MRRAAIMLLVLACAGCDLSMTRQAKPRPEEAALWPAGPPITAAPEESVAVDATADSARPPLTLALLERGRDRYRIYCTPCHGERGRGVGPVVARGFPPPPSYDLARLRTAPADHFYRVITDGYGVMFSYADRLPPRDRWAVAAYVRALQLADAPKTASGSAS